MEKIVRIVKGNPLVALALVFGIVFLLKLDTIFSIGKKLVDDRGEVKDKMDASKTGLTPQKASGLAERIYGAINHFWGTDEDAVYTSLTGLTKEDIAAVYNAFGTRNYSRVFSEGGVVGLSEKLDMFQILKHEMNDKEIKRLKALNPVLSAYL